MNQVPSSVWKNPVHFAAFGFGSGAFPVAPGTVGTLAAILPYLWLSSLSILWYILVLIVATLIGVWLCDKTSNDIGVHDHSGIVWDEFVGFWLTMTFAPDDWFWLIAGFVFFRFFDILKPWPINWLDLKVSGGWGIMLDDLLAGVYAAICLYLSNSILTNWQAFAGAV